MTTAPIRTLLFLCLLFGAITLSAQVPPGTGAGSASAFNDSNFTIVSDALLPHETAGCSASATSCSPSAAPAWIVTQFGGWAPAISGTRWIAPDPDQSNATRNGNFDGSVTYQTVFTASPTLKLYTRVLADDSVTVSLNGTPVFSSQGGQYLSVGIFTLSGFINGKNTVKFAVSNAGGGPTGLDVSFEDAGAPPTGASLAFSYDAYPAAMTFAATAVGATTAQTLYVVNNGDAPAIFASIGPPSSGFSIDPKTQSCGAPLGAGSYCTFSVDFTPTSATPPSQTGTLKISLSGAANPSTYTVNLAGSTAVATPTLMFSPTSLTFPATPIGASSEQVVIVTDNSTLPAIFSDYNVPGNFTIDYNPPTTLAPACRPMTDASANLAAGKSCAVGIAYAPTTTSPVINKFIGMNFEIDLLCTGCDTDFLLPLTASIGNGPILTFSPNPLMFPPTPAGTASLPMNVTVRNAGNAVATISGLPTSNIFVRGTSTGTPCVPTIAIGGSCTMSFTFNPPATTAAGTVLTADPAGTPPNPLNVILNLSPSPNASFPLTASGIVSAGAAFSGVTLSSATGTCASASACSLTFSEPVGVASGVQTVTLTNTGTVPLNVTSSGGNTLGFALALTDCGGSPVQPASHCFFNFLYDPASATAVQTTVTINETQPAQSNSSGQQTITLIGTGQGPAVSLDNTTVTLLAPLGGVSPTGTVTLTNTGTADLHISNVVLNGSSTGFTNSNDSCLANPTIHAKGTCTLQFNFNPSTVGPSKTTVTITDDATPGTQTITLLGGISGPALIITPVNSPGTPIIFPSLINTVPLSTTVTLTNAGSVDLTIQNFQLATDGNGFSTPNLTSCFGRVLTAAFPGQIGGQCTIGVAFSPIVPGNAANSIVVTTSPSLPATISLLGEGLLAPPQTSVPQTGAVSLYAVEGLPDPVDGGTGQFHEDDVDLNPGGPLNLQWVRYYGSGLSAGGYQSSLGVNWMSNFDVSMALNNNIAEVLLFRGKIVSFSKAGGSWTLTSPANVGYQFAAAGTGFQFMSPVSNMLYTFDASGKLASIADRKGNVLAVTQGASGPAFIADGLGRTLTLVYSGKQLASVQDQTGRTVTYSYTGNTLSSYTDALKKTTQYSYAAIGTSAGLMTKKQLPAGNIPAVQTYDAGGKVIAQTDGNGNTNQLAYDGKGGTTITGALGDITQQANNGNADLGGLTDPSGKSVNVTFDSAGHRTGVTDKNGKAVVTTYHAPSGKVASRTDELGNTISYSYSAQVQSGFTFFNLTGTTYEDGTSKTMSYDTSGNLTSTTAADGSVSAMTYDAKGHLLTASDPYQQVSSFVYNSDGTLASREDPLGNQLTYSYTPDGHIAKINDANSGVSTFTYDADGRVLSVTDPTGAVLSSQYDDNGQRVAATNKDGGASGFTYDSTGMLTSVTDPLGNRTAYAYDAEKRPISITNAAGEAISRTYDSVGHLMSNSDNNGPRVNFSYDAEGRILSQTDPLGNLTGFAYDAAGKLTGTTKADGTQYTFAYDPRGRYLSRTNPLGEVQSVTRDAMGRVTQYSLPGGLTTGLQLDLLGHTTAITSPNGNIWAITRDALGRVATSTDPLGNVTTRSYTGTWLSGMTLPLGSLTIVRDKAGRITQRQYSDGTIVNAAYDPMGLIVSADGVAIQRDVMGRPVNENGMALTYTPAGRLASLTYAAGKTVTYAYDPAGRLSAITDWAGGQSVFTYDAANRLTGVTYPNAVATNYSFDVNGRLSGIAAGSLASITLTRDPDGKITAADRELPALPALQSASQQFTYNAAAQMVGENVDTMGRALTETGRTYTWNLASQLTGFQDGVNSATLTYDGLGELASSNVSGVTVNFVFNHATSLPALSIIRVGGGDLRYYVYTPGGKPLYSIEAADNTRHFLHFDEMGNTAFLTGDDGSVTDMYAITPYGDVADHVGPTDNPFTWQGQDGIIQESQGLYFVRNRHYDASASRFVSPDPLKLTDPRATEPYAYARGNPLLYTDPMGSATLAEIRDVYGLCFDNNTQAPTLDELASLNNSPATTDAQQSEILDVFTLVADNPGVDWSGLMGLASNAPGNQAPPPAAPQQTILGGLASCQKLNNCLPSLYYQLATAVELGLGNSVELISQDGGGLISQDGGGLISQDGGGLIGNSGSTLIGNSGSTLIGNSGSTLIGNSGSTLIGNSGSTVVSNDGGSVISNDGGSLTATGLGN